MSNDSHNLKFDEICDEIFALSPAVRSAIVIDKMGRLVAGGMRKGITSMEEKDDTQKLYVQFALRSVMREDFDEQFGKTLYSFSERERIKLASFPLDDQYIVRVSIEKEESNHTAIIDNILRIIGSSRENTQKKSC
ncbi:MAG TPA: DUF6659 family protein [Nitrososphaeraceae archaeon]|jgi:hypothetical protein|nr:DUF6659 family protein [Nitrososphaeraceae archaeon]